MAAVTMSLAQWVKYRDLLATLSKKAADEFRDAVWSKTGFFGGVGLGNIPRVDLIDYAYALVSKYGEGASEAACELYDALAELSGERLAPAVPAATPTIGEVAETVNGVLAQSLNDELISAALGRLVKQAGQDTTLQNAKRDGAQVAWIPHGLTCPFCIALASRGWREVSDANMKDTHAKHIHANCDCAYGVRFNDESGVAGYNPDKYLRMYNAAPGKTSKDKLNAMRREAYAEHSKEINAQKRSAYEKAKERESSRAEEIKV